MTKRILDNDEEVQLLKNILNDDNDFFSHRLLTLHYNNEFDNTDENSINYQPKEKSNSILH